ncbi:MAG: NADH:ubiquinone reductase (Na(+)-transporting) subunit B [Candidatus Cloacimonadota bacterium]|nr:MAG: NADH:ubiquinone reductase (Na(+)-transporting) subunit B [Candidatus Cloacimonadota bacterium]
MKLLLDIFEKSRKDFFGPGKVLEQFEPGFDAAETFLFSPVHMTKKGPHVRDSVDTKRYMSMVIMALIPALLFGIYNAGYQSQLATSQSIAFIDCFTQGLILVVPLIILSYAVGGTWEAIFAVIRKHPINEGFLVTGLLFPLILPPTIPLWQAAIGISFGVVIGKEVFGGTGMNVLNPALVARAFCFFSYPGKMSGDNVWVYAKDASTLVDGFSGATPLAVAAAHHKMSVTDPSVVEALSAKGFDFMSMFSGLIPGSIGETSTVAIMLGALILAIVGVASFRTMLSCVFGAMLTGLVFYNLAPDGAAGIYHLPPHLHLVMGGFAFGCVFMATDPVSSAATNLGKMIYGFGIGVLAVLIRTVNPAYPEGMMLAILFMNVFAPLIDFYVIQFHIAKRRRKHE